MTHAPTETMWIVAECGERYGPFKSLDDARAFATQTKTGFDCEILEYRGQLVGNTRLRASAT